MDPATPSRLAPLRLPHERTALICGVVEYRRTAVSVVDFPERRPVEAGTMLPQRKFLLWSSTSGREPSQLRTGRGAILKLDLLLIILKRTLSQFEVWLPPEECTN
jgi:hypothetical protein